MAQRMSFAPLPCFVSSPELSIPGTIPALSWTVLLGCDRPLCSALCACYSGEVPRCLQVAGLRTARLLCSCKLWLHTQAGSDSLIALIHRHRKEHCSTV